MAPHLNLVLQVRTLRTHPLPSGPKRPTKSVMLPTTPVPPSSGDLSRRGDSRGQDGIGAGANVLLPAGSAATIRSEGTGVPEALVLTLRPTATPSERDWVDERDPRWLPPPVWARVI